MFTMFGYVTVNPAELDEAQKARFAAYYCGLCRRLRADHGVMGRMTLTYDMTFLTVLLTSLYDEETKSGRGRCPAHPAKQRALPVVQELTKVRASYTHLMDRLMKHLDFSDVNEDDSFADFL